MMHPRAPSVKRSALILCFISYRGIVLNGGPGEYLLVHIKSQCLTSDYISISLLLYSGVLQDLQAVLPIWRLYSLCIAIV